MFATYKIVGWTVAFGGFHMVQSNNNTVTQIRSKLQFLVSFNCSVAQSCPTLCNPMDFSTPGLPVLHHLPELAQTRVHWVSVAIQPSRPLSLPFPPAFNLSQHQGLFSYSHQMAKVSELQLQHQSFQWMFSVLFPLGLTGLISLQSKGHSRVFFSTTVQKPQFFSVQPAFFIVQLLHLYMTTGKTIALTRQTFVGSNVSAFQYAV